MATLAIARTLCNRCCVSGLSGTGQLYNFNSVRTKSYLTSREWRQKHNRFRARLDEIRDFSYTDGRGLGPVSVAQKRRYLRDQELAETVVRRFQQLDTALKFEPMKK